jgi:hypothetical protein
VPWFYEGGFDSESVDFVEHAFYQAFGGVFSRAVRTETRDAEGAGSRRENEVAAGVGAFPAFGSLLAEVGEGEVEDVEGTEEVGVELGAQIEGVLVFAGADYAVAGAAVFMDGRNQWDG